MIPDGRPTVGPNLDELADKGDLTIRYQDPALAVSR